MKNKIIELSVSYKQKIIEDIQKLVQIPSVLEPTEDYIFGSGIKESLHYVLNRGAELGFSTVNVDDYAGHIEYGQGAEILGVLCHVDVVPADGDWVHGKFAAQIEDNRIYGRGTSDDKGINAGIILAQFLAPYTTNKLVKFIASLTDSRLISIGLNVSTEPMGDLTMNVGIININDKVGMAGLNFRYPNGMDDQQFICQFKEKAEGINVVVKENKHPHFVSPDSKLVKDLHEAYIDITNDTTTPIKTIGGGTYARAIKNAVAFGTLFPNEAELAHEPDEYIAIDSAIKATAIIANAIYKLTR